MEHGNWFSLSMVVILSGMILGKIWSARSGRELFIRKIPGVDAIDEAVGRATEMGRPILFSTGLGGLDIITLQALSIVGHVARLAAQYRTRIIVPMVDTVVLPVAEEICREAYNEAGQPEAFHPDDIRFLSGSQFAYASGVVGIMNRERVSANFFFGSFFAESLILAETGQAMGAVQVAGTPSTLQIPFFIVSCDYTVIGEEYYATSAYLTREPTLLGSLVGQDYGKVFLSAAIVIGLLSSVLLGKVYHPPPEAKQMSLSAATIPAVRPPVEAQGTFLISSETEAAVRLAVRLPRDGDYVLWARIGVQEGREDSFAIQVNGGPARSIGGETVSSEKEWSWVHIGAYPLKSGKHHLTVTWHTPQGRLDKLVFCRTPPWPQIHPQALAFHASSGAEIGAPVRATPEALVSPAGGSVRFPFKIHQEGEYTVWLHLGPASDQGPLPQPAMRVQIDRQPATKIGPSPPPREGGAEGPGAAFWVPMAPVFLAPGEHSVTVTWLEEAALYEIFIGRPGGINPATTDPAHLAPFFVDYVPDDVSVNSFLVEPDNRYMHLWTGG